MFGVILVGRLSVSSSRLIASSGCWWFDFDWKFGLC